MAGNKESGRKVMFPLSENELAEKFEKYREDLKNGDFDRASVAHFCFYIGTTEDALADFIREYSNKPGNAYYGRAQMLRVYLQYFRGELCSSKSWSGQLSNRAQLLLSQDYGDGIVYRQKADGKATTGSMIPLFGRGDPRAKDAGK